MLAPLTKICKKCGVEKPAFEFHVHAGFADGRNATCAKCICEKRRKGPRWPYRPKFADAKFCMRCETVKPFADFNKNSRNVDGRYSYCRSCQAVDDSRTQAQRYVTPEFRARVLHRNALKRGLPGTTLTYEHVLNGIKRGTCPVTGIAFDLSYRHREIAGRSKCPYAPSLDRIDPKKPYTDENVRVVIWQYNMFKGEITDSEVLFICKRVIEQSASVLT